ncbi:IclR family transcriptional regulator [Hydrogenophaga sp.]|uniref:IclR family transcriptional regulator n=1 Tax=Hydrogenophaga sp. TaxID=1904254 RepID=UPI00260F80DC|nr:IclR family transcriptional regulator [Hydrogenophaga sp.]MCW5652538.1 IclR family transcriptional regulator [Hydrogenophaga sp.]
MNGVLERTLGILELLSQQGEGMELAAIADRLNIPRSAVHRLLADLVRLGYVRQARGHGDYLLTTKLVSMGLSYLGNSGIVDIAQPLLNRLAEVSGELARLSVIDGERLTWVARAQGARQGLRYDPDMGSDARLSCSSSGWAWLSTLSDDDALALLARQGLGLPEQFGPNAPPTLQAAMEAVRETRERGYSLTVDTYTLGLSAISAPVRFTGQPAIGVLTIAGPTVRFTTERMQALAPELLSTAQQLAAASGASPFFNLTAGAATSSQVTGRQPIYAP